MNIVWVALWPGVLGAGVLVGIVINLGIKFLPIAVFFGGMTIVIAFLEYYRAHLSITDDNQLQYWGDSSDFFKRKSIDINKITLIEDVCGGLDDKWPAPAFVNCKGFRVHYRGKEGELKVVNIYTSPFKGFKRETMKELLDDLNEINPSIKFDKYIAIRDRIM
ncbi:MAG: hypothetical protein ABIG08_01395 [bacterium]